MFSEFSLSGVDVSFLFHGHFHWIVHVGVAHSFCVFFIASHLFFSGDEEVEGVGREVLVEVHKNVAVDLLAGDVGVFICLHDYISIVDLRKCLSLFLFYN